MEKLTDDIKTRFLHNSCSDAELQAVREWLDESDANVAELFGAELIADMASQSRASDPARERIAARIQQKLRIAQAIEKRTRRVRLARTVAGIAAVLAVVVGAGLLLLHPSAPQMKYVASADQSMSVILPDSTVVYLNKYSRLGYPERFADNCRRVELDGEGYFEVSHDEKRPFRVEGRHLNVEVLGTHFNFESRDSGHNTVSLLTGSVEVRTADRCHGVVLEPGQKASYSARSGHLTVQHTNATADAAWHDGMIPFENANLREIVEILRQLYGADIELDCGADLSRTYSGATRYCSDLHTTLTLLENTLPITFICQNGKTVIYSR